MDTSERRLYLLLTFGALLLVGSIGFLIAYASPQIASAVVTASATILVATTGTLLSKHIERRQEIERELREKKVLVYQDFMSYWFTAMSGARGKLPSKKRAELDEKFRAESAKDLVSWASPKLIKDYGDWVDWDHPERDADVLELEEILLLMRQEFGFDDTTLKTGDLLRTFQSGVEERIRTGRTKQLE
jgi:hypothetical protein